MMGFGVTLTGRIGRESQRSGERVNLNWCGGSWGAQALRPRSRLGCTLWAAPGGLHSKAPCCAADTGRKRGSPAWRVPRELRVSRGFGPKPKLWTGPEVHAGSRGEPLWRRGRWDCGAEGAPRGLRRPRVRSLGLVQSKAAPAPGQPGRSSPGVPTLNSSVPNCPPGDTRGLRGGGVAPVTPGCSSRPPLLVGSAFPWGPARCQLASKLATCSGIALKAW